MNVVRKVAVTIIVLVVLALFLRTRVIREGSGGHHYDPLEITVRVVDRDSGEPLADAVVATVRFQRQLKLEWQLKKDLRRALEPGVDRWRDLVCATKTTEQPQTTIHSAVCVTRYGETDAPSQPEIDVPDALLIDHPRHGRTIIPIDPETPVEEGNEPSTWRLDLGTVRVPE